MIDSLRSWPVRRWVTAVVAAVVVALLVGLPTDVIPNPVFGRPVPVTWWSYPTLALTAVLGGLLAATYVRERVPTTTADAPARRGGIAGMLAFFAVGCPVCNKIVVLALGTTGAMRWFPPLQHLLAVASIVLMAIALRGRLRDTCAIPAR